MKKSFLLTLATGLACSTLADAQPPTIETFTGTIGTAVPTSITKVKWADGKVVADGPAIPYTDFQTRSSMITAVAFDCYGLKPGTAADFPPSPACTDSCGNLGPWWFGASYRNPTTLDDMVNIACPPGSAVERIDLTWYQGTPGTIIMIFFMYQDLFDVSCPDPATFTTTGTGVAMTFSSLPAGAWTSNVGGLSALGMTTPSAHVNPSTGLASGCYKWIMAGSISSTGITLFEGPCSQYLYGTGDAMGQPARPGTQDPIAYDGTAECYDYSHSCPNPLGKMVAFGYLRCPADFNNDGFVDGMDADAFNAAFESYSPTLHPTADLNGDCFVDGIDYDYFNAQFESLCP